jgi:TolA-binding protein
MVMSLLTGRGLPARERRRRPHRGLLCSCVLFAIPLLAAHGARAQGGGTDVGGSGGRHVIQGRLIFPSGRRADVRLKVRLESVGYGDLSVVSDANGTFYFRSLRHGSYTVLIDGGDDYENVSERVYIEMDVGNPQRGTSGMQGARPYTVQIFLKPKRAASTEGRAGVFNAALASVPKPALGHYQKAQESARAGDYARAIESLRAAVAAHPQFALALSEMGALYLKTKQPDKAAESFRSSLKIAPDDYATLVGYGVALFDGGEFGDAEDQFRRALKRNEASTLARLYLGRLLIRGRKLGEAEAELRRAAAPGDAHAAAAHYYLGGLYWAKQDYRRAADELEAYLRLSPKAPDAERVRATVKELREKK